jgi:phosphoribosylamine-glycine ligase
MVYTKEEFVVEDCEVSDFAPFTACEKKAKPEHIVVRGNRVYAMCSRAHLRLARSKADKKIDQITRGPWQQALL